MTRSLLALSLLALVVTGSLTACSDQQSGGSSNPDSQVEQPPLPDQTEPRSQGPDPSTGVVTSTAPAN